MTILVTGANGFIGSALCESLLKDGLSVRGAARTMGLSIDGAESVAVGDICKNPDWAPALKGVEQVVHLAARVHTMHDKSEDSLAEFRRVNVEATVHLARQAAAAGIRRFVFLSSIKVNGETTVGDQKFKADDAPAPEDPYGISKHEAEQELWKISAESGMEVVVLRLPLVYGPGVKGNFLRLLQAVDGCRPLPLRCIQNRRSLVYVGNLVDAIGLCTTRPGAAGKTLMVSDGDDVSTPELVRRMAASLGRRPWLLYVPVAWIRWAGVVLGKQASVDRLVGSLAVDISQLQALGWQPPYAMQKGLTTTMQWYRAAKVRG